MNNDNRHLPAMLQEIVAEFASSDDSEKVELLLYYAEQMPPLPDRLRIDHDGMEQVEECMTPVYVTAETEDGKMTFFFDVPPESPTVRGFAAIMAEGLNGSTPEQILAVPNDFFFEMGLERVLTMQRLNGIGAILAHMKRLAAQTVEA